MDLNSSSRFDARPFLLEFLHHLLPDKQGFIGKFLNSIFSLLLKHVETEATLDDCGLLHQEPEVFVRFSSFVHSEVLLNANSCQNWTFWSLKNPCRYFDKFFDLFFVSDTVEHRLFTWLFQVVLAQFNKLSAVNVCKLHVILGEKFLKVHKDERDSSPPFNVCPSKADKLRCLVNKFSLPKHQLVERVFIHQLVVASSRCVSTFARCFCRSIHHLRSRQSQLHCLSLFWWWKIGHNCFQTRWRFLWDNCNNICSFWNRLQIKLYIVCAEILCINSSSDMHISFIMELHASKLNRWCTLFECWSQINIFWNHTSLQETDHAFIDIFFADRRRVI